MLRAVKMQRGENILRTVEFMYIVYVTYSKFIEKSVYLDRSICIEK